MRCSRVPPASTARGVVQTLTWLGRLERDGLESNALVLPYFRSARLLDIQQVAGEAQSSARDIAPYAVRVRNESLGSEATLSSQIELRRESQLLFDLGRISEAVAVDAELFRRFNRCNEAERRPHYSDYCRPNMQLSAAMPAMPLRWACA